jgi:ADP-ribose pyrophosphatase
VPGLPDIPKVELQIVGDRSAEREGFLSLKRVELVVVDEHGARSASFRYDMIERRALDAAVMAAHHVVDGKVCVFLRSAVRPPILLRPSDPERSGVLWELPAGLIEPGETPGAAAARELEEELGFTLSAADLEPLGPSAFPAPGFIGERHWFFHVRVDESARMPPSGDGSPLEEGAQIISIALDDALAACRRGEIRDSKTELALRRLTEILLPSAHGQS